MFESVLAMLELDDDDIETLGYGEQRRYEVAARHINFLEIVRDNAAREYRETHRREAVLATNRWRAANPDYWKNPSFQASSKRWAKTDAGKKANRARTNRYYAKHKDAIALRRKTRRNERAKQ